MEQQYFWLSLFTHLNRDDQNERSFPSWKYVILTQFSDDIDEGKRENHIP